jgi:hypothetical protein
MAESVEYSNGRLVTGSGEPITRAALASEGGWVEPTMNTGWSATPDLGVRLEGSDTVRLRGGADAEALSATLCFTLAAAYRPSVARYLPVVNGAGGPVEYVAIETNGQVTFSGDVEDGLYVDGVTFTL